MIALLLAAAEPQTAIEAERALAADTQRIGQWTAFRKWAATDAVMFVPQGSEPPVVNAQKWLKERSNPSASVFREPAHVWQSCDGSLAVATGTWRRIDNSMGSFITVWKRQPDGAWRWVLEDGNVLAAKDRRSVSDPKVDCRRKPPKLPRAVVHGYEEPGGTGQSADTTLRYGWTLHPNTADYPPSWSYDISVDLWNGRGWSHVFSEYLVDQ